MSISFVGDGRQDARAAWWSWGALFRTRREGVKSGRVALSVICLSSRGGTVRLTLTYGVGGPLAGETGTEGNKKRAASKRWRNGNTEGLDRTLLTTGFAHHRNKHALAEDGLGREPAAAPRVPVACFTPTHNTISPSKAGTDRGRGCLYPVQGPDSGISKSRSRDACDSRLVIR